MPYQHQVAPRNTKSLLRKGSINGGMEVMEEPKLAPVSLLRKALRSQKTASRIEGNIEA